MKTRLLENIKKRIILVGIAILAYIFVPIPISLLMVSFLYSTSFPVVGFMIHAIRIFIFVMVLYGALAWVKPSLIPPYISKNMITGIIIGIIILSLLPSGMLSLGVTGSCTIYNNLDGVKSTNNNGRSTEQECIDSCTSGGQNNQFNQKSCTFEGVDASWNKTPEDFKGYKPNL
jgi:hypothetical protein